MSNAFGLFGSVRQVPFAIALLLAATGTALAAQESTIFTFDGQDFVRTHTTFTTPDGKSAMNTKLDRNSPAFKALVAKQSFAGKAMLFKKECDANYAPMLDASGKLTGALFVALCGDK
jgi:methyl-accepting chemotaxis protein